METTTTTILSAGVLFNVLLGGVIWFMKQAYTDLKEQVKEHKLELERVKEVYFKKEDFKDFKTELWDRLDKLEHTWSVTINELRNK